MNTLTDKIFQLNSPYNNPYQGKAPKWLFVCSAGILRSATSATLASRDYGANARAAGSMHYALVPISGNLIAWADKIFFVNKENYDVTFSQFKDHEHFMDMLRRKSDCWDIPDQYPYMHEELQGFIKEKLDAYVAANPLANLLPNKFVGM